ncbi:MAG TPA: PQQ-binding-like beta-propeller repeat protein, partial [Vulgatibacter sp.]
TALIAAAPVQAALLPPTPEVRRGGERPQRFRALRIDFQRSLTEREILEYKPRELAGPAIDPVSGDVVVGNRRGLVQLVDARGRVVWEIQLGAGPVGTPALTEEAVFVGDVDGFLHAIDRFDGTVLWSQQVGGQVLARPVAREDAVFAGTDHDAVHALDPATGETLWVYRRSTPAALSIRGGTAVTLAEDRLFAGFSDGAVVALDPAEGRMIWQTGGAGGSLQKFPDSDAAPILRDGIIYATAFNDGVQAYDAATGKLRWRVDAQGAASLAVTGDLLLVGGAGKALALKLGSGAVEWSIDLGKTYVTRPVVAGKMVLLSGPEGILVVAADTGKPLGRFTPGSGFSAPPAAKGTDVYALSDLGYFYKLELVAGTR